MDPIAMNSPAPPAAPLDESVARLVADALRDLRFGTILLTVHEGRVTAIDTTQRTRLPPPK